jgi:hypothetical protein
MSFFRLFAFYRRGGMPLLYSIKRAAKVAFKVN